MAGSRLIDGLKALTIWASVSLCGELGQVWLESDSMIRKLKKGYLWEREISLLKYLAAPGDACLDIGANCGQWTYWMSKRVGFSGKVIAVEPVPVTARVLRRVAHKLRLRNVEIRQIALGDKTCQIGMTIPRDKHKLRHLSVARVSTCEQALDPDIVVDMTTRDSLAQSLHVDRTSFIKCDIEGGEMQFFKGGQFELARDRPNVVCEIEQRHTARFGYQPEDLLDLLESMGYLSFRYVSTSLVPARHSDLSAANYVFIHSEAPTLALLTREGILQHSEHNA